MLKHCAIAALGVAVLFGVTGPAAAGKGGHHWIGDYPSPYVYPYSYSYGAQSPKYLAPTTRSQPNIRLDFETEAVWRNLRPEWFD